MEATLRGCLLYILSRVLVSLNGLCSTQTQGVGYSLICLRGVLELVSLRVFRMQTSIFLAIKKKKTVRVALQEIIMKETLFFINRLDSCRSLEFYLLY